MIHGGAVFMRIKNNMSNCSQNQLSIEIHIELSAVRWKWSNFDMFLNKLPELLKMFYNWN